MFPNRRTAKRLSPRALKNHLVIIFAAIAVFVATHVCLRIQLQKHSSSIRMNRANGVAEFERRPIRYNKAQFMFMRIASFLQITK